MKKNSQIHIYLESDTKAILEKQAKDEGKSVSVFCRDKLRESSGSIKTEFLLKKILEKMSILEDRTLYKRTSLTDSKVSN